MWKSRKLAETNHLTKFRWLFRTHSNNIDRTISANLFTLDVNRVMRTPWRPHIESKTEPQFTNTKNHEHLQFLKSILSESTRKTLKGLLNSVFVKCKGKYYSRIIAGWPSWSEITFLFHALPMTQNYNTRNTLQK